MIPTYELTMLHDSLMKLAKKNMAASGIRIELSNLDDSSIGTMDFHGELLPKLIPVLLASIEQTLTMRLETAKSDVNAISRCLGRILAGD